MEPARIDDPILAPSPSELSPGQARGFGRIVSRSSRMHEMVEALELFARTDLTIWLIGETGCGKDVIARAIHEEGSRAQRPFVVFDCGAVTPSLAESEFLGHERGAFTGASEVHAGAFERAHGGTLFLDELAALPLSLQPVLLRALESRSARRVGGKVDRRYDVRVISATHVDLRPDVCAGRFREDLFYRVAVADVRVPPLRDRLEDLPLLAGSLLEDLGRPELRLAESTFALLRKHVWPGNVRELKNALACAITFVDPGATVIKPEHLRLLVCKSSEYLLDRVALAGRPLEEIEREAIVQTMARAHGDKVLAARFLGVSRSTMYNKLKKYGL
jgi:transcriptional regulator with PAS, ATPase and Fis domain